MTPHEEFLQRELAIRDKKIEELKKENKTWKELLGFIKIDIKVYTELKKAASELIHLHLCEQEGIVSGQPTSKQWLEAVDKLSELLNPKT